jgi:hypothetical protein
MQIPTGKESIPETGWIASRIPQGIVVLPASNIEVNFESAMFLSD